MGSLKNFITDIVSTFKGKKNDLPEIDNKMATASNNSHNNEAEALACLRYAYHNAVKSHASMNEAIAAEDLDANVSDLSQIQHRIEAASALEKYAELSPDNRGVADDIEYLLLEGSEKSIRQACAFIRSIYASSMPKSNVRLAYTTINTQSNEPYLMCPKAQKQIGQAMPMEISKCRDYCIDSRRSVDGHVSCAYKDWLTVVADNQANVMARLDAQKLPVDNGVTLNDITRPGPAAIETSKEEFKDNVLEDRGLNKYYKSDEVKNTSIEGNLMDRKLNDKNPNAKMTNASSEERRTVTASSNNNTKEVTAMKKGFNLSNYIKNHDTHIQDKLEVWRTFFDDSLEHDKNAMSLNIVSDNSKYESSETNMEKLISERHTGVDDRTQEDQLFSPREEQLSNTHHKGERPYHATPKNETLEDRRNNDPLDFFMKTMEEHLSARHKNDN